MNKTKIEYLTHTYNPLAMRCTPVSEGCEKCWHQAVARRLAANPALPEAERAAFGGGPPVLRERELDAPLRRQEPARIGVQFMGDLFHERVDEEWIGDVFDVIHRAHWHKFLILTKRPEVMRDALADMSLWEWEHGPQGNHVQLGVSCENQRWLDGRTTILLQIPAPVHFVSLEPLLGPVNISRYLTPCPGCEDCIVDRCKPLPPHPLLLARAHKFPRCGRRGENTLDWVIVGGESGPGARPMELDWARRIRDDCQAAGVPFFYKRGSDGSRLLDGREWNQMPATTKETLAVPEPTKKTGPILP